MKLLGRYVKESSIHFRVVLRRATKDLQMQISRNGRKGFIRENHANKFIIVGRIEIRQYNYAHFCSDLTIS